MNPDRHHRAPTDTAAALLPIVVPVVVWTAVLIAILSGGQTTP